MMMKRSEFSIVSSKERSDSITLLDRYHNSPELNKYFTDNVFLTEVWHGSDFFIGPEEDPTKSTWRSKERMKTTGVALVLCLNIGTDPPGIIKPHPCARKECWLDPFSQSKQKSLEMIGNTLQMQYEKWQPKAKYKQCLDPSPDDLKRTCVNLRKATKGDRLLLHYNGHGVPIPTKNGELWVFFKNYTHYMPVSASELKSWLGEPAIYVFDCSGAGTLIPFFAEVAVEPPVFGGNESYFLNPSATTSSASSSNPQGGSGGSGGNFGYQPPDLSQGNAGFNPGNGIPIENSSIVLASCRRDEILPMNPQYPADLFSACLTTPIAMAIRWLIVQVN